MSKNLETTITNLRNVLAEAEDDITRDTASRLKSNINKMKEKFSRDNKRLNEEIERLKKKLRDVEEKRDSNSDTVVAHLKMKLKELVCGDQTVEMVLNTLISRVGQTVANLSEELVNTNEDLYKSNSKNENLRSELDKMKAIVRTKTGNVFGYRKRIKELESLSQQLEKETDNLKSSLSENASSKGSNVAKCMDFVINLESIMDTLKSKLRNDHDALLAAGNPDCLKYIARMAALRMLLKQLHVEIENSLSEMQKRPNDCATNLERRYLQKIATLENCIAEINVEINNLRLQPVTSCTINGSNGLVYLKKVEDLESLVEKSKATLAEMKIEPDGDKISANAGEIVEKLKNYIGEFCTHIKQLEIIANTENSSNLFARIGELEESVVNLKVQLSKRTESTEVLKEMLEQRTKELEEASKNKILLEKELENTKKERLGRFTETQQMKNKVTELTEKLQEISTSKRTLLDESERMRRLVQRKDQEILHLSIVKQKLEKELEMAAEDNKKLKQKGISKEFTGNEKVDNLQRELQQTRLSLNEAHDTIAELHVQLNDMNGRKKKLEEDAQSLAAMNTSLRDQLNDVRSSTEEAQNEYKLLISKHVNLEKRIEYLRNENEELKKEVTEIQDEKKTLKCSLLDANKSNAVLQEQNEKLNLERDSLRTELNGLIDQTSELANAFERSEAELQAANGKLKTLTSENSQLREQLEREITKKEEAQTLTNELTNRTKELSDENSRLKNDVTKTRAEKEYLVTELNKSRQECEKAKSKCALLQIALDDAKSSYVELKKKYEEMRVKYDEIRSEYRILDSQVKILRNNNEASKKLASEIQRENGELKLKLQTFAAKVRSIEIEEEDEEEGHHEATNDEKTKSAERKESSNNNSSGGNKERKNSSEKSLSSCDKTTKSSRTKVKNETKKLRLTNEGLKLELANLRTENTEMKIELARVKNEFRTYKQRTSANATKEIVEIHVKESEEPPRSTTQPSEESKNGGTSSQQRNTSSATWTVAQRDDLQLQIFQRETRRKYEILLSMNEKLRVVNAALKAEIGTLRDSAHVAMIGREKAMYELQRVAEEMRALKMELVKLRDERGTLKIRLDKAKYELSGLKTEKGALKEELNAVRDMNADLRAKVNELQDICEKLGALNGALECRVVGTLKEINKYTISHDKSSELEGKIAGILQDYASMKKSLGMSNALGASDHEVAPQEGAKVDDNDDCEKGDAQTQSISA